MHKYRVRLARGGSRELFAWTVKVSDTSVAFHGGIYHYEDAIVAVYPLSQIVYVERGDCQIDASTVQSLTIRRDRLNEQINDLELAEVGENPEPIKSDDAVH
jgi:hypothetical protein